MIINLSYADNTDERIKAAATKAAQIYTEHLKDDVTLNFSVLGITGLPERGSSGGFFQRNWRAQ